MFIGAALTSSVAALTRSCSHRTTTIAVPMNSDESIDIDTWIPEYSRKLDQDISVHPRFNGITDLPDFLTAADDLKDVLYSIMSELARLEFEMHTIKYITTVSILLLAVDDVRKYMEQLDDETQGKIKPKIGSLYAETNEVVVRLLSNKNLDQRVQKLILKSHIFCDEFYGFMSKILSACEVNMAHQCGCIDSSDLVLKNSVDVILSLYRRVDSVQKVRKGYVLRKWFSCFSESLKSIYLNGNVQLFKNVESLITPDFPLTIDPYAFDDLVMFYKYLAFNLTVLSVGESIEVAYALKADHFYRCLLVLPSSDYDLIPNQDKDVLEYTIFDPRLKSLMNTVDDEQFQEWLTSRHEISLLFIINCVLISQNLQEIVAPSSLFRNETVSFVKSFSNSLTEDIRRASATTVTSGNGLNLQGVTKLSSTQSACGERSWSSVILNGTYKEKHVVVLKWARLLSNGDIRRLIDHFTIDLDTDDENISDSNKIYSQSPSIGAKRLLEVFALIAKFFRLLKLKYTLTSTGSYTFDDRNLTTIIGNVDLEEILRVKPLLSHSYDGSLHSFELIRHEIKSQEEAVKYQIALKQSIAHLNKHIDEELFEP